jgi:alkanesulfonate monooxygenase SsuD/methylene tetrahydromethanopterin reductase-like flavin-dependent oxidoreductase (luciferase family)
MVCLVRYGIDLTGFGTYADARVVTQVAIAAEEAGWDGLFLWDHLAWAFGFPSGDPWISLAAAAAATRRIRLGTSITPVPRRRPQVLAVQVAALDRLSDGRLTFGAGLGGTRDEFEVFGEPGDEGVRAKKLDEGLDVLARLWSGERVDHRGEYFTVRGARLAPLPAQQPHPPVWIGGASRGALRRAARWDGYTVGGVDEHGEVVVDPGELGARVAFIGRGEPFDVAITGVSEPEDHALRDEYGAAGATWWLESLHDLRGTLQSTLERVAAGP